MKKLSFHKFMEALSDHNFWLSSDGKEGKQADFSNCDLREAMNEYYDSQGGLTGWLDFSKVNFSGAKLSYATLRGNFESCNFEGADLRGVILKGNFGNCDFTDTKMSFARTENLNSWEKEYTNFSGSAFLRTDLDMCEFPRSRFNNCLFDSVLCGGLKIPESELNGVLIKNCFFKFPDFSECSFDDACIGKTVFSKGNMSNTRFRDAIIDDCDFKRSEITFVTFEKSYLKDSAFADAYVEYTDFPHTTIKNCSFDKGYNVEQNKIKKELGYVEK